jgi:hypothetical protein
VPEYRPRPSCRGHGSSRGEQAHGLGPGPHQRRSTRPSRRAGGEHVVDEHDRARCLLRREHPAHRLATRVRASARLRSWVADTSEERDGWCTDHGCHRSREHSRLVVPTGREPVARERDPGDRAGRPRHVGPRLDHGAREGIRDDAPSTELQPVDRAADRPVEPERRARDRDRVGRAIAARDLGPRSRRAAPFAPRRQQHDELGTAPRAERPRPRAASRTPLREQRIEQRGRHRPDATAPCRHAIRRPTAGRCRPQPPTPCRVPSAPRAGPRRCA